MFKKFLKLIKKNEVTEEVIMPLDNKKDKVEDIEENTHDDIIQLSGDTIAISIDEELEIEEERINILESQNLIDNQSDINQEVSIEVYEENKDDLISSDLELASTIDNNENEVEMEDKTILNDEISSMDQEFIKEAKIKRERTIKAIDLYTQEEQVFKTYKDCSKKLRIPLGYIKENLKYGHTDYLGEAITFLYKELNSGSSCDDSFDYLNNSKTPMELYNTLNNRIFTARISEKKRDLILSSDKIEPIKMHYTFECIDEEYDDYFIKYKSIIQRGGKKKIELIDKKGEAIEIFKSLEDCSTYLGKEKIDVVDMLKYGETKVGRYEIRYSLRNI